MLCVRVFVFVCSLWQRWRHKLKSELLACRKVLVWSIRRVMKHIAATNAPEEDINDEDQLINRESPSGTLITSLLANKDKSSANNKTNRSSSRKNTLTCRESDEILRTLISEMESNVNKSLSGLVKNMEDFRVSEVSIILSIYVILQYIFYIS